MDFTEDFAMRLAKERMEDAMRAAERSRAIRLARGTRRPVRVRLGSVLVRVGYWLMGGQLPEGSRISVGLERAKC